MDHGILILDFITHPIYEFLHERFGLTDGNHFYQVTYTWLYMIFLIVMGFFVSKSLKLVPGRLQNFLEVVIGGLKNLLVDTMGEHGMRFFPLIATIALFIFTCNMAGIIPGFYSPTANLNTNLCMALTVFLLTHIVGVRIHGMKYLKHFMGPVWWMAPIMIQHDLIAFAHRQCAARHEVVLHVHDDEGIPGTYAYLCGIITAIHSHGESPLPGHAAYPLPVLNTEPGILGARRITTRPGSIILPLGMATLWCIHHNLWFRDHFILLSYHNAMSVAIRHLSVFMNIIHA